METIYFGVIAVVTASVAATWQQERNFYHFEQQQYPHSRFFFHICCSMYGLFSNFCRTKSSKLGVGEALFIWDVEVGGVDRYFLCRLDVPFSRVVPWTLANDLSFVGHNLKSRIGDSLPQQLMAPWQPCKAIAWKWKFSSGHFSSLGVSLRKQKCSTGLFIYDNGKWKMIAPCLDQNICFCTYIWVFSVHKMQVFCSWVICKV